MHILIRICCVVLISFSHAWAQRCHTISGKLALETGKSWDDLVQDHFSRYKRLGSFVDMLTLKQSCMHTVLEWPLAQQANHADYVAKRMANECESAFIGFAEDAAKQLRTHIANGDSFHNSGAACNVAFLVQTLPEGRLRSELLDLHSKLTDMTKQNLGQVKFEL